MLLSRISQNKISEQILLICPEKPSDYKGESSRQTKKRSL